MLREGLEERAELGDVALAVLVLATSVLHFGWAHEAYAMVGSAEPTTVGWPLL